MIFAQELVHAMLAVDPSKRLTTHQILSHQVDFRSVGLELVNNPVTL